MEIRRSRMEDLPAMLGIYERARAFMAETGNPNQWGPTNWPPEALLVEDIAENRSYVCEQDGKVIGTFCHIHGDHIDATYDIIHDGAWSKDLPYGVVHRLASDGTPGVGSICVRWAIRKSGYLRIDTHSDNSVMISLLQKLGFRKCGIIYVVEDDYPRYAYDISYEGEE